MGTGVATPGNFGYFPSLESSSPEGEISSQIQPVHILGNKKEHPRRVLLFKCTLSCCACSQRAASLRLGLENRFALQTFGFAPSLQSIRAVRDGSALLLSQGSGDDSHGIRFPEYNSRKTSFPPSAQIYGAQRRPACGGMSVYSMAIKKEHPRRVLLKSSS